MKVAHGFVAAGLRLDLADASNGVQIIGLVATDEADVARDDLRARAFVAAYHRRPGHQRFNHAESKRLVDARREEKSLRAREQLRLPSAAHVADILRANLTAQRSNAHDAFVVVSRSSNDELETMTRREREGDVESLLH